MDAESGKVMGSGEESWGCEIGDKAWTDRGIPGEVEVTEEEEGVSEEADEAAID